jgi:RNA polymerase sigma factor FliA
MPRMGSASHASPPALPASLELAEPNVLAPLWARWRSEGESFAREQLIEHHLPYARMMAATLYGRRTHNDVEFEDYLQFARIGLIEAIDRFDPLRGAQFKTFATKRVQGAILNGLARFTEKNQQIALSMRLRRERLEAVKDAAAQAAPGAAQGTDSPPSGRQPEELFRYLAEVGIGLALSVMLEDTGMIDSGAPGDTGQLPSPEVSYFRQSEIAQLRSVLRNLVDRLGEQQRMVIHQHYLQEVPFEEIARRVGLTRGRVSQLHRQALGRLRELLGKDARFDVSW